MTAVITLTTDLGARDPYVAEMKAVILGLNPTVRLIDVSHEIAAHDVIEGALAVQAMAAVCPVVRTFGDLPIGGAGALAGSHGRLEVAVREGSAAARFRARRGTTVLLSRSTTSRTTARTRW